jgi:hypothetical protein
MRISTKDELGGARLDRSAEEPGKDGCGQNL